MFYDLPSKTPRLTLSLFLLMMFISFLVCGQIVAKADSIGVKTGDWIKYSVVYVGTSTLWIDLYEKAVWIRVEVENVSASTVSIRETRHLQEDDDIVRTLSWNLQGPDAHPIHFIPPIIVLANLGPGDVVERCDLWITYGDWVNVELTLNDTSLEDYGGVTREVNVLEFSQTLPYFEYTVNLTHRCVWDKETGFLLERVGQITLLDYEGSSASKATLRVADTNLWKMETGAQSQLWMWALVGLVSCTIAGGIVLKKISRPKENST